MKKRSSFWTITIYLVVLALIFGLALWLFSGVGNSIPYSEVVNLFENEQVKSFVLEDGTIYLELYSPYNNKTSVKTGVPDAETFRREMGELIRQQYDNGILVSYDFAQSKAPTYYSLILPLLIVGVVLLILWMFLMSRANANNPMNNFGKARTLLGLPKDKTVTFEDVAGADEEKEELQEVVALKSPDI